MKVFFIVLLVLNFFTACTYASDSGSFSISFGQVKVGEHRIPIDLRDFKVIINTDQIKIKANFLKKSVQWIRTANNLLQPRARLGIRIYNLYG